MAEIVILGKDKKSKFTVTFCVEDMYVKTSLGCHAGTIGKFNMTLSQPGNPFVGEVATKNAFKKQEIARKLMDKLVEGAENAWGGWTNKVEKGTLYRKKGHWIISAPWEKSRTGFSTDDMMGIILQFCKREPKIYGRATITPPSECAAHGDNAGFPATRTLVWIPPYAKLNPKRLGTWYGECYSPARPERPVPKKKIEPSVVSVVQ